MPFDEDREHEFKQLHNGAPPCLQTQTALLEAVSLTRRTRTCDRRIRTTARTYVPVSAAIKVAKVLKERDENAFRLLATTPATFHYQRSGHHLVQRYSFYIDHVSFIASHRVSCRVARGVCCVS